MSCSGASAKLRRSSRAELSGLLPEGKPACNTFIQQLKIIGRVALLGQFGCSVVNFFFFFVLQQTKNRGTDILRYFSLGLALT